MLAPRRLVVLSLLLGCHPTAAPTAPTAPLDHEAPVVACYAGSSEMMGKASRALARRTVDPVAHRITEQVTEDTGGAQGARKFEVVMEVDGDRFTMKETRGAFTGTGTLVGPAWAWTSWTSTATIPGGITVTSHDELTATGLTAHKEIRKDGQVVATTTEELTAFDCLAYDDRLAGLIPSADVPVDRATCEAACRNFATLTYWDHARPELEAMPAEAREARRTELATTLTQQMADGLPGCVTQCGSANNPAQTRCLAAATTYAQTLDCP